MDYTIKTYIVLFFIYAIAGWIMETVCKSVQAKKFVNRGFLIGPYCPIYGYGAVLITFLLKGYIKDPIVLFFMAIIICGTLEYLTSYIMEKVFNARWWDYSKRKYNINGRVCLETIIPFGILGLGIMYVTNPFIVSIISNIQQLIINIIIGVISAIFVIDNIVSFVVIFNIKGLANKAYDGVKDNTEEISAKVKEMIGGKSFLHRRVLNAFPNVEHKLKNKIRKEKEKIKQEAEKIKQDIKENMENVKEEIEKKK